MIQRFLSKYGTHPTGAAAVTFGIATAVFTISQDFNKSNSADIRSDCHLPKKDKPLLKIESTETSGYGYFQKVVLLLNEHYNNNKYSALKVTQCEASLSSEFYENDDDFKSQDSSWYYKKMEVPARFEKGHAIFDTLMGANEIQSYIVYKRAPILPYANNDVTQKYGEGIVDDFTTSYKVKNGIRVLNKNVDSENSTAAQTSPEAIGSNDNTNNTELYPDETEIVLATFKLGSKLKGHSGIVHGGIISLLFDDCMGFAYEAVSQAPIAIKSNNYMDNDDVNTADVLIRPFQRNNAFAVTANLQIDFRSPLWQAHADKGKIVLRIYHEKTVGRKIYLKGVLTSMDRKIIYAEGRSLYIWVKPKK